MQRASYVTKRLVGDPSYSHICIAPTDRIANSDGDGGYEDFHFDTEVHDNPENIPVSSSNENDTNLS